VWSPIYVRPVRGRSCRQQEHGSGGAIAALNPASGSPARECWIPVPFPAPVGPTRNFLRHFRDREKAQPPQAFARQAWGFSAVTNGQISLRLAICLRSLRLDRFTLQAFSDVISVAYPRSAAGMSVSRSPGVRLIRNSEPADLGPKPPKNMRHLIPAHLPTPEPTPNARQYNMGPQRAMWSFD
jgi:hypothetical protein